MNNVMPKTVEVLLAEADRQLRITERVWPMGIPLPYADTLYQAALGKMGEHPDPELEHRARLGLGIYYGVCGNFYGRLHENHRPAESAFTQALPHLRRAYQLQPEDDETRLSFAQICDILGLKDESPCLKGSDEYNELRIRVQLKYSPPSEVKVKTVSAAAPPSFIERIYSRLISQTVP